MQARVYRCCRLAQCRAVSVRILLLMAAGCSSSLLASCQTDSSWSGSLDAPNYAQFATEVYPILLRDCAYSRCHGAPERFFRIFGPGRAPLLDDGPAATLAQREVQASYDRARSMLISDGSRPVYESPLLLKPLALGLGGASHEGVDVFGRNVYRSLNDPAYLSLVSWAISGNEAALPAPGAAGSQPSAAGSDATAGGGAVAQAGAAGADPGISTSGPASSGAGSAGTSTVGAAANGAGSAAGATARSAANNDAGSAAGATARSAANNGAGNAGTSPPANAANRAGAPSPGRARR
jgi:hypothetical protein